MKHLNFNLKKTKALSLLELVLSMTIVSIALTTIVLVFLQVTLAPPAIVNQQALNIANGYLTEILSKSFPTTLPCSAPPASRANYTSVCNYNNLIDIGAKDNQGNLILGMGAFNVAVSLDTSSANLGGLTAGTQIIRVDVVVTNPKQLNSKLIISAYKGKH
jgi:type II secretory pathway pseudopilin PulG